MKLLNWLYISSFILVLVSCGETEKHQETLIDTEVKAVKTTGVYTVNTENTTVTWQGKHYKDTAYVHTGTIAIANGNIVLDNGDVVGGTFKFDMNSIVEPGSDTTQPWALQHHFKKPDFFDVVQFPEAIFSVANYKNGEVTGVLDIKGISQEISFPADLKITEDELKVTASFSITLLEYGLGLIVENEAKSEVEKQEGPEPKVLVDVVLFASKNK